MTNLNKKIDKYIKDNFFNLSKRWTDHLLKQPQTGLGWQLSEIKLKSGGILENIPIVLHEKISKSDLPKGFKNGYISDIVVKPKPAINE